MFKYNSGKNVLIYEIRRFLMKFEGSCHKIESDSVKHRKSTGFPASSIVRHNFEAVSNCIQPDQNLLRLA